jgi:uncharacterized FAD-dependent dehydrogenase
MTIRINNLRISIDDDPSRLKQLSSKKIRVGSSGIKDFRITKESIDARRKGKIDFIYSVEFTLDGNEKALVEGLGDKDVV